MLNVPMIGMGETADDPLQVPLPSALFFVCIGVYSTHNDMFQVGETIVIGLIGYLLLLLGFHPASMLLGFVLGPRLEEIFRRAMLISGGDALVFVRHPVSAFFLALCALVIFGQIYVRFRPPKAVVVVETSEERQIGQRGPLPAE